MKLQAKHTVYSCYLGYVTQAIVNNLPPLLFLTFNREFAISPGQDQSADHGKFLHPDPGGLSLSGGDQTYWLPEGCSVFLSGDDHRTYRLLLPSLPSGSLCGNPDLHGI